MFKKVTLATAALALATAPAFAGSPEPAPVEPVLAAPAPVASSPDWTGFYAGGQIGYANVDTNVAGVDGDGLIGGIVGGYDWDLGNWVVGVGADWDFADISLGAAADLEQVWRLKTRGGYKIGNGLAYATVGYANADTDNLGDDDGYFIGAGYEHLVTQNFSLGGEVLYHEFDNFNSTPTDVEATTVQLRGTFRF
ncbi:MULTISPECIES: outer membrane protein [unclassified Roseovarius]|uniref:outer membrane protein n=1 Tax=unclassified Roseovarius TaxID=2614913 RepID=UPI00273DCF05|nr:MULTISPECIES: porin family protein [unclassified Roseovarius]